MDQIKAYVALGLGGPTLGVITSFQEQLEWGLRIVSLVIGIAVGIYSLMKIKERK
jgi:hypothetical protein